MAANYDRIMLAPFVQPHVPSQLSLPSLYEIFPEYVSKPSHRATPTPQTPHVYHSRNGSCSSSATSSSARSSPTGSPSPPPYSAASSSPPPYSPTEGSNSTVRIVLAPSFDGADAVLLYTAPVKVPTAPLIMSHPAQLSSGALKSGAPLLLVKDALAAWNAAGRRFQGQVRAHPYKLQRVPATHKDVIRAC